MKRWQKMQGMKHVYFVTSKNKMIVCFCRDNQLFKRARFPVEKLISKTSFFYINQTVIAIVGNSIPIVLGEYVNHSLLWYHL